LCALILEIVPSRGALSAARSLARAGWTVGVGHSGAQTLAGRSRLVAHTHRIPRPEDDLACFLEGTARAVRDRGYEIVFPSGDGEILALSLGRGRLSAVVPYPPHEVVRRALDKLELMDAALRAGLVVPRTETASAAALGDFDPPLLVKARTPSVLDRATSTPRLEPTVVSSRDGALKEAARIRAFGGEPLYQELVEGDLLAYSVVVDADGKFSRACSSALPRSGRGRSAEASVPLRSRLKDRSRRASRS
jgi:hypothetical protein